MAHAAALMDQVSTLINDGGFTALLVAAAGGLAAALALVLVFASLFGAASGAVRKLSFACLLLAIAAVGIGVLGITQGRKAAETAAGKARPAAGERLKRKGWLEARANLTLALPLAAPAAFIALVGFIVSGRRRLSEINDAPPSGPVLFILFLLIAIGAWVYGGKLWKQPAPGRELDDSSWKVLDLTDALDANEWEACLKTTWSLGAATPAHALGAHADNQRRCVEHFTAPGELERLLAQNWVDDVPLREATMKRIGELRLAEQAARPAATPEAAAPTAPVDTSPSAAGDPALADLAKKLAPCFKKKQKVDLHVTIAADGRVSLPKKGTSKCALHAISKLKLPAGHARTLDLQLK